MLSCTSPKKTKSKLKQAQIRNSCDQPCIPVDACVHSHTKHLTPMAKVEGVELSNTSGKK